MTPANAEQRKVLISTRSESDLRGFEQIGQQRFVPTGTVIQDRDSITSDVFIVLEEAVDLLGTANREETVLRTFELGSFSGEMNMLAKRKSLISPTELHNPVPLFFVDRKALRTQLEGDAVLGNIFLAASFGAICFRLKMPSATQFWLAQSCRKRRCD